MNKKRLLAIAGIVLLAVVTFISCNSEFDEELPRTSVSFAPSASKALNQGGSVTALSTSLSDYHWKYYCSETAPVTTDTSATGWYDFDDAETGLGTIKDLLKGSSYYFGLRGYTKDTSYTDADLIWEGFHYSNTTTKEIEPVVLNTKKQIITIDVYTKGMGYLYFNISAPLVTNLGFSSGTCLHSDRFYYAYESLDGKVTGTDYLYATLTDVGGVQIFDYADAAGTPKQELAAGVYLFTVKQQTWDIDKCEVTSTSTDGYVDVNERAQILIVNIVSGVDTVIGGTLDSAGLVAFEYEAYSEDAQHGIQLAYHYKNGSISTLGATVYNSSNPKDVKTIYNNDIVYVSDTDYLVITWTTDANLVKLYFNGDLVSTATDEDGFFVRSEGDEEWTYLKTSGTDTLAYGKRDTSYIVTGEYQNQTMSFTVVELHEPEISVTISFKANTTDTVLNMPDSMSFLSGSDFYGASAVPTREGYRFLGWYKDTSGTDACSFPEKISTDTDYYAKWKQIVGQGKVKTTINGETQYRTWVQLWENGPKFAEFNLGSTINTYVNVTTYSTENVGGIYLFGGTSNDYATSIWGSNWRTPTINEINGLTSCVCTWCDGSTVQYAEGCTLAGMKVTGKGIYEDNTLFIPAAGFGTQYVGQRITYWSSSVYGNEGNSFYVNWPQPIVVPYYKTYKFSIRPILAI